MLTMVGKTLSHYSVLRLLGAGGMGEVYLAHDNKLDRTVALKILPPETAEDKQRMGRFLQEARAASALSHPNVAHIYEIGEAGPIHFIVMEHIEGSNLDSRINGRPMETEEIVNIAVQAADALDEAHSRGIIHRDIKAANIMVTPRGQVKILDFGLAKITSSGPDHNTQVQTDSGVVLGTVYSMSPEQALGKHVDHRADIFSLGVVLYQMATGRPPFTGETTAETLSRILHEEPDAIARFNYNAPPELDRIIRKCLEKDASRRYQSTRDLLVDLRNLKRDLDSGGIAKEAGRVRKPNMLRLAAFILIVAAVAAVIGFMAHPRKQEAEIRSLAVLPFANAESEGDADYISDGITEGIINSLCKLRNFKIMARSTVFRYKGRNVDPREAGKELNVQSVLVGVVARREGALHIDTELVNVADGSLIWGQSYSLNPAEVPTIQSTIAKEISSKLHMELTGEEKVLIAKRYTANPEAYELYLKGRFHWNKRTPDGFSKGIEFFQQAIEKDPGYALPYAGLADSFDLIGYYGLMPAKEVMPKAKSAAMKALEIDESLAEAHASLGDVKYFYDHDWSGAEKEFQRAIQLNPSYSIAHHWYGSFLIAMGRSKEAEAQLQKAQELDPLSISNNAGYVRQLYFARRYDEAIRQYKRTLELDPHDIYAKILLGLAYIQSSRVSQAVTEYQNADALSQGSALTRGALAYALAVSGNTEDAWKIELELEERSAKEYVPPFYMAVVSTGLGDKDRAFHYLGKANEERDGQMVFLKVEPLFDRLRSDPRFTSLMREIGLPE